MIMIMFRHDHGMAAMFFQPGVSAGVHSSREFVVTFEVTVRECTSFYMKTHQIAVCVDKTKIVFS